jgi:DNA-binding protein Fis
MTKGKVNGPDGAAFFLGINPSTLRNRMKKLGIDYGRKSKS